ncbi:hypothetical protein [Actinocorallia sp. A-T 12471]|uniref:hypothetical protein n=1 Tax=Actinocorallia sp. A-T 12471 TaxID=3089813 RepID=UPI0029D18676|nr:hypothetical protein [Actinocorallia sp. A-T 12471]MDX6740881.1 hypothetical protein [Actinocorallia sp. A-T 12471]
MNTDEIEIFRAARPEVAPYEPGRRARARQLLLRDEDARRSRRWWLSAVPLGALAGAAGVAGVLGRRPDESGGIVPVSAVGYLEEAARTVEARPEVRPGPLQWRYTKERLVTERGRELVSEVWMRLDGAYAAQPGGRDGKIEVDEDPLGKDEPSPLRRYAELRVLAADPEQVLARAYRSVDGVRERWRRERDPVRERVRAQLLTEEHRRFLVFCEVAELFDAVFTPPRLHAAAFRAVAQIPGVEVRSGGRDPLGREVVSVGKLDQWGTRRAYLVAPGSYVYLGVSAVRERDDLMTLPALARGQEMPVVEQVAVGVGSYTLREAGGIVDRPGERG